MKHTLSRCIAGLLLACTSSCVAFSSSKLPADSWPPPAGATKQAINVEVVGNVIGNLQESWTTQATRAMSDSKLFSEVSATSRTDSPLRARIDVRMRTGFSLWGTLSAASLYVLPAKLGYGEFVVRTTFLVNGVSRGVVTRVESYSVWGGVLSIFLVPFGVQEPKVYYNAIRSTLVEAREEQVLR